MAYALTNFHRPILGGGGLSEGFQRAGFEPVAHVEMDEASCFSIKTREAYWHLKKTGRTDTYMDYMRGQIDREALYSSVPKEVLSRVINLPIGEEHNAFIQERIDRLLAGRQADLIIGGPPCQAYSLVGRARSANGMEGDPRNFLYIQYVMYLERYQPKMFVFENVPGLESAGGGKYLQEMVALFFQKGYRVHLFSLDAADFGVLQRRKRLLIIGWQANLPLRVPALHRIKVPSAYQVKHLLEDLPSLQPGEGVDRGGFYKLGPNACLEQNAIRNGRDVLTQHVARETSAQNGEIYRIALRKWGDRETLNYKDLPSVLKTHRNTASFLDRFKVVDAEAPFSHTVCAHISKDGSHYIHPDACQNRSLTVREAARLQSFPDDFYFEGKLEGANRTSAFQQIGNAVPPLMAEMIAAHLKGALCGRDISLHLPRTMSYSRGRRASKARRFFGQRSLF